MQIKQYPLNYDGSAMKLLVGVMASATGGGKVNSRITGPDGAPIDNVALILSDFAGNMVSPLTGATPQTEGATGDYDGATGGATDAAAMIAAINKLIAASAYIAGVGYSTGAGRLTIPKPSKSYFLGSTTIDIIATVRIQGDGVGGGGGLSTVFRILPDTTAFRIQSYNTVGDTGVVAAPAIGPGLPYSGSGSVIAGVGIVGPGWNGTTLLENPVARGVFMRGSGTLRDMNIWNMQGPAVEIHAGVGLPEQGNANIWEITNMWAQNCTYGILTSGGDTNAGLCILAKFSSIRAWGIYDGSGAANTYLSPLAQLCGVSGDGTVNRPSSNCHVAGEHYTVVDGQEAWASVNPPPAGHNSNQGWIWFESGGAVNPGFPTWFNGMFLRSGGSYRLKFGGTIFGGYMESSQPPAQLGTGAGMIGGTWGGIRPVGGGYINFGQNSVLINNIIVERGGITTADDLAAGVIVGRYSGGTTAIISAGGLATGLSLSVPGSQFLLGSSSEVDVFPFSGHGWFFLSGGLHAPFVDNAQDFGSTSKRIANIWAGNNVIQTSDRDLKQDITPLSDPKYDKLLNAVSRVKLMEFRYRDAVAKKGDKARRHFGFIAQDLVEELEKEGLDPFYGGVVGRDIVMEDYEEKYVEEDGAMRVEYQEEETNEVVDGKVIRTIKRVPHNRPDFDHLPVHDEEGNPVIIPARPASKRTGMDQHGNFVQMEIPATPARQLTHPVRRMVKVTKTRRATRPVKDAKGNPVYRYSARYEQFLILREAARDAGKL